MVLATSGLTGEGVVEGIDWVAQCVVRNMHARQKTLSDVFDVFDVFDVQMANFYSGLTNINV